MFMKPILFGIYFILLLGDFMFQRFMANYPYAEIDFTEYYFGLLRYTIVFGYIVLFFSYSTLTDIILITIGIYLYDDLLMMWTMDRRYY